MSGSGATCFGLFATREQAWGAAETMARARPDWWIRPTVLNAGTRNEYQTQSGAAYVEA